MLATPQLRWFFIVVFFATATVTLWLYWNNRASEQATVSFWSVLSLGTLGTFISLFFGLKEETQSITMPTSVVCNSETKVLLKSPVIGHYTGRPMTEALLQEAIKVDPALRASADGDLLLFREIITRELLNDIYNHHPLSWVVELSPYESAAGRGYSWEGKSTLRQGIRTQWKEIRSKFPASAIFDVLPSAIAESRIPPSTEIRCYIEDSSLARIIEFRNPFVELTIKVQPVSWGRGVAGLQPLLKLTDAESNIFASSNLQISGKAIFNKLKSGHPEMADYRAWVRGIFSIIQWNYDGAAFWKTAKENVMLQLPKGDPIHDTQPYQVFSISAQPK